MSDETIDLRIYMRAVESEGGAPTWQPIVDAARRCGITEVRVIEGLLGVGSRGMIKPSNWVMRREIPVILELRGPAGSMNSFVSDCLADVLRSGTAASEAYGALDPETVHEGLPNLSAELAALLRVSVDDDEHYEGTTLFEAAIHIVRGLGVAGATVYRNETPDANGDRQIVVEAVDLPPTVAELARCLGDLVDPARIMTRQVAMMCWHDTSAQ